MCCMSVGTGKTLTGVKIAYWFVQRNKSCKSGARKQVLFCGPSNNSVDVAGMVLLSKLCSFLLITIDIVVVILVAVAFVCFC